jgi:hypothetical protein
VENEFEGGRAGKWKQGKFISCLFNDAICSSDAIAAIDRMIMSNEPEVLARMGVTQSEVLTWRLLGG